MTSQQQISICIPTRNRSRQLSELLDSIRPISHLCEVCVSDNASEDDTPETITHYGRLLSIRYVRHASNLGPDANYLEAANLARTPWLWLSGDDDHVRPAQALQTFKLLPSADILLTGRRDCTIDMTPVRERGWWRGPRASKASVTRIRSEVDFARYLSSCTSLGGFFSFLGSIFVRRERWLSVQPRRSLIGSGYIHAQILAGIMAKGCTLTTTPTCPIDCRIGDDSFLGDGVIRRFMLDVQGYLMIAEAELAGMPRAQHAIQALLRREHPSRSLQSMYRRFCAHPHEAASMLRGLRWIRSPIAHEPLLATLDSVRSILGTAPLRT